jgi:energy-coupling factor transport system substrate-specific component
MQTKSNGLRAKDLINIGIFTAIYFVTMFLVACLGYIPIFIPALAALCPLIGGIPFMLFATKVRKFGAMLIMIVIIGLFYMFAGGLSSWILPIGVITGLAAELIVKSGKYQSAKRTVIAYGVWCIAIFGNFVPTFFARDAYYARMIDGGYGQAYADAYMRYMPELAGQMLVLAPHEGAIPSDIWLACRKKTMGNRGYQPARKATSEASQSNSPTLQPTRFPRIKWCGFPGCWTIGTTQAMTTSAA